VLDTGQHIGVVGVEMPVELETPPGAKVPAVAGSVDAECSRLLFLHADSRDAVLVFVDVLEVGGAVHPPRGNAVEVLGVTAGVIVVL